jgi:hypothetical protein
MRPWKRQAGSLSHAQTTKALTRRRVAREVAGSKEGSPDNAVQRRRRPDKKQTQLGVKRAVPTSHHWDSPTTGKSHNCRNHAGDDRSNRGNENPSRWLRAAKRDVGSHASKSNWQPTSQTRRQLKHGRDLRSGPHATTLERDRERSCCTAE